MLRHALYTFFFFNDPATTEISTLRATLSLHDALPISAQRARVADQQLVLVLDLEAARGPGRRSEEHTSELQSPLNRSYAVFCLKKNNKRKAFSRKFCAEKLRIVDIHFSGRFIVRFLPVPLRLLLFVFFLMIRRPPRSTR